MAASIRQFFLPISKDSSASSLDAQSPAASPVEAPVNTLLSSSDASRPLSDSLPVIDDDSFVTSGSPSGALSPSPPQPLPSPSPSPPSPSSSFASFASSLRKQTPEPLMKSKKRGRRRISPPTADSPVSSNLSFAETADGEPQFLDQPQQKTEEAKKLEKVVARTRSSELERLLEDVVPMAEPVVVEEHSLAALSTRRSSRLRSRPSAKDTITIENEPPHAKRTRSTRKASTLSPISPSSSSSSVSPSSPPPSLPLMENDHEKIEIPDNEEEEEEETIDIEREELAPAHPFFSTRQKRDASTSHSSSTSTSKGRSKKGPRVPKTKKTVIKINADSNSDPIINTASPNTNHEIGEDEVEMTLPAHPFFVDPDLRKRRGKAARQTTDAEVEILLSDDEDLPAQSRGQRLEVERQKLRLEIAKSRHEAEVMFNNLPSHPFFQMARSSSASAVATSPSSSPSSFSSLLLPSDGLQSHHGPSNVSLSQLQLPPFPLPEHQVPSLPSSEAIGPSHFLLLATAPPFAPSFAPDERLLTAEFLNGPLPQPVAPAEYTQCRLPAPQLPWLDKIRGEFFEASLLVEEGDLLHEQQRLAQMDQRAPTAIRGSLWVDRFRPARLSDWVGPPSVSAAVQSHLFGSDEELSPHILLHGPLGVGKTTLVYLFAEVAGLTVIELHAGELRSGSVLQSSIEEATQSNSVVSHTIILVEDVDQFFPPDKGFIPTLNGLLANSKRPIILTSSNPDLVPRSIGLDDSLFQPVRVAPNHWNLIAFRALAICNQALHPSVDRPPLRKLIEALAFSSSWDLRKLINALQLHCSGPVEYLPATWDVLPALALGLPASLSAAPLHQLPSILRSPIARGDIADACAELQWDLAFDVYLHFFEGNTVSDIQDLARFAEVFSVADVLGGCFEEAATADQSFEQCHDPCFASYGAQPLYQKLGQALPYSLLAQMTPVTAEQPATVITPFRSRIAHRRVDPASVGKLHASTVRGFVPVFRHSDVRGACQVEYAWFLREVLQSEQLRSAAPTRRRFMHYLCEFPVAEFGKVYMQLGGRFSSC
ncbi:MAG: AAA family ATPase [archaeon]|nr:AAA family ATPase [archaeon]